MKKRFWLIPICLFIGLMWYFATGSTSAIVKIVEVNEDRIIIGNMSSNINTVSVPKGISKLINEGSEYFIVYEYRKWMTPSLVSIEPSGK